MMMRGGRFMRRDDSPTIRTKSHMAILSYFLPFFLEYKWRALGAICFMVCAKIANLGVPIALRELVNKLDTSNTGAAAQIAAVPTALVIAYGALRLISTLFGVLRDLIFVRATEGATTAISARMFSHLLNLGLRFHLERRTGNVVRDLDRGLRGVHMLVSFSLYNIIPISIEFALVLNILASQCGFQFVLVAFGAMAAYVIYTFFMTGRNTKLRRKRNVVDSEVGGIATDALLNFETVRYFNNADFERTRYTGKLNEYLEMAVSVEAGLSGLSAGQQLTIALGLVAMLWVAAAKVAYQEMSIGDLVMVNSFMLQLYVPLASLGGIFRQMKTSITDLEKLILLLETPLEITDAPNAPDLVVSIGAVRFKNVSFAYEANRTVLHNISFEIPGGKMLAVVGPSGAGKSTLARLLFRFYDVTDGSIEIDNQNVREVTQKSLHGSIGIVPQDSVLFNETIGYNINYGRPEAPFTDIQRAAEAAQIHKFISALPAGYDTVVGERGLKLSGGEKQRVATARTLLKNPPILVFDEATSALDSANERALQRELGRMAVGKTSLVIAHRLSTVMHADEIIVMEDGHVVERGTHLKLLGANGAYAKMWRLQQGGYLDVAEVETSASSSEGSVQSFEQSTILQVPPFPLAIGSTRGPAPCPPSGRGINIPTDLEANISSSDSNNLLQPLLK